MMLCLFILSYSDVLVSVLKACEPALNRAFESRKKMRQHANQAIDEATRKLHEYEKEFYPK